VGTVTANSVAYTVSANTENAMRSGSIVVNGVVFPITQGPAGCSVTLSPAGASVGAGGGSGSFLVSGQAGCRWQVSTAADWVTLNTTAGEGSGTIIYTAAPYEGGAPRTAAIHAGNQTFTLQQAGVIPSFSAAGVLNAASFAAGSVAPGLIVTIFGSGLGPRELVVAEVDLQARAFPTQVGGTQVLFDGVAAPMIYSSAGQLSAVVPFGVAGRPVTRIEVVSANGAVRSAAVSMPVSAVAPGIFTRSAQGSGPGAILNQDFSVNQPGNGAAPGSIVSVFATGGGVLDPPGADGRLSEVLSAVAGPVTVTIDGRTAEVFYSGGAPNLIHGALQFNVRIHADARPGELPLVIRLGDTPSQANVTVSVR
jgi:uncharacterized protein (TIGR03437 family)